MRSAARVALTIAALAYSMDALAYVGPGMGAGTVAAVLGVLGGILMLIVGVVWYPLKRLVRRIRERK